MSELENVPWRWLDVTDGGNYGTTVRPESEPSDFGPFDANEQSRKPDIYYLNGYEARTRGKHRLVPYTPKLMRMVLAHMPTVTIENACSMVEEIDEYKEAMKSIPSLKYKQEEVNGLHAWLDLVEQAGVLEPIFKHLRRSSPNRPGLLRLIDAPKSGDDDDDGEFEKDQTVSIFMPADYASVYMYKPVTGEEGEFIKICVNDLPPVPICSDKARMCVRANIRNPYATPHSIAMDVAYRVRNGPCVDAKTIWNRYFA